MSSLNLFLEVAEFKQIANELYNLDLDEQTLADTLEAQRVAMQKEEERKAAVLIEAEKQRLQREAEALAEVERKRIQEEARIQTTKSVLAEIKPASASAASDTKAVSEDYGDIISAFLKTRNFPDESRIRAILIEFIRFESGCEMPDLPQLCRNQAT